MYKRIPNTSAVVLVLLWALGDREYREVNAFCKKINKTARFTSYFGHEAEHRYAELRCRARGCFIEVLSLQHSVYGDMNASACHFNFRSAKQQCDTQQRCVYYMSDDPCYVKNKNVEFLYRCRELCE
ncbi:hypothetical protein ElyMa_001739400 [Elysia marginata]|uniref:Uncharacterized protein n=1 Tax=Elysia marginata TaxID=1093978 RepID=A0AAV4JWB6_9GAST|nr:hypothetical protein ElyMa_001739400 [Elysia marginata]